MNPLRMSLTVALTLATATMPAAVSSVTASAVSAVHCNTYTMEKDAGVTCTNSTNQAYWGVLIVECANKRGSLKKNKAFVKHITVGPNQENVVRSVTCPAGTTPLPPTFTGPTASE